MTRRVLVTRPQPGAGVTAERLTRMGFSPVLLPLTAIEPVTPPPLDPDDFDAVAVTSVNAVRHAPAGLLAGLREKPLFAVGDAGAQAARDSGFEQVRSAAGSARELAALIGRELPSGARILHLAGTERTAGFAEALRERGFPVGIAETYRAREISYSTDFLKKIADDGPLWGALALSPRAGALLVELAGRSPMRETLENARFFCISENAAAPLRAVAGGRVSVSREPTEDGVLALLSSQG